MPDTDAPRWRLVADHGQPSADDYPLLALGADPRPYVLAHHDSALQWVDAERWCPITLPVGDEPKLLPKPWRDPATMPFDQPIVIAYQSGDIRDFTIHEDGLVGANEQRIAWCLPSDLHPFGGAS